MVAYKSALDSKLVLEFPVVLSLVPTKVQQFIFWEVGVTHQLFPSPPALSSMS